MQVRLRLANIHRSDIPDSVLMLANHIVAIDHVACHTHLLAICKDNYDEGYGGLARGGRADRARSSRRSAADARSVGEISTRSATSGLSSTQS